MTREEAIYWIKNLAVLSTEKDMPQIEEALNMAIEALQDRKTEQMSKVAELEKRVEWLELQMRLVHRTLDKIDRKTEPKPICESCSKNPCKKKKMINDIGHWVSDCTEFDRKDEPQTDCAWK